MINKWADKGKFTVIKVGSRVRIRRDELRTGWNKEIWKGACNNMASIRERNEKFNVIYLIRMKKVRGNRNGKPNETKAES